MKGIPEIRAFFRTNQAPIYFVSPTAFNLLGIDRWLRGFFYINYFDPFDGSHPRIFVPRHGTIVGPLIYDLIGHPELTPHKGGCVATTSSPTRYRPSTWSARASSPASSATAWRRRATVASSKSTTSWIARIHSQFSGLPVEPRPPAGALAFKSG